MAGGGGKRWGRGRGEGECWFGLDGRSRFENLGAAVRRFGYLAEEDRDGGRGWGAEKRGGGGGR